MMRFNGETQQPSRQSEGKRGFRHLPLGTRLFCLYLITNYKKVTVRRVAVAINKIVFQFRWLCFAAHGAEQRRR